MFTRYSWIFRIKPFEIGIAIFPSVSECQGDERTNENDSADFANFDPKIDCHGNVP